MNDLFGLIGKLLPVGVIAGLAGIFYLLDVFSVRPSFDGAPPQRAPATSAVPGTGQMPAPVAQERARSSAPQPGNVTSFPQADNATTSPMPPPGAAELSAIPRDDLSAAGTMTEDAIPAPGAEQAPPSRYVPPQENQRQPITRGIDGEPPPSNRRAMKFSRMRMRAH